MALKKKKTEKKTTKYPEVNEKKKVSIIKKLNKRIAVRFMGWNVQYYNSFIIDLEIQCNLT